MVRLVALGGWWRRGLVSSHLISVFSLLSCLIPCLSHLFLFIKFNLMFFNKQLSLSHRLL